MAVKIQCTCGKDLVIVSIPDNSEKPIRVEPCDCQYEKAMQQIDKVQSSPVTMGKKK